MRIILYTCACVFFATASAVAQTSTRLDHPLTLAETLEVFRSRNQSLVAAKKHVDALRANEVTAALRPNPVFTSANEDFDFFHPALFDPTTDLTQNVSQLIERGGKRKRRIESARLAATVAEQNYYDTERQLLLAVKQSFVSVLLAKANLQLAQENSRDYARTVGLNDVRYKAGDISRTDFDRIKLQQARFDSDLLNAELSLAQARAQLKTLLGVQSSGTLDVAGDLDSTPPSTLDSSELQRRALEHRPDYLAVKEGIRKAQADIKLADAGGATDFNFGSEFKRSGTENFIGFTFSFPLRIFDRNQGEKLRTRFEFDSSQATEVATRLQVIADVDQAYAGYVSALKRSQLYSSDYSQRAKDVRDRIEFSYLHGGSSLLEYIAAIRDYRDIELASRSAGAQVLNAVHQLSFATGTELLP